jgi:hypothetical protein
MSDIYARSARSFVTTTSGFRSSCSHTLMTRQPSALRVLFTSLSRDLFLPNFKRQNSWLFAGMLPHFGQQCQKHPSIKMAIRSRRKQKSGRPVILRCRRHPTMAFVRSRRAKASSVSRLLRDFMRAIISERFLGLNTSGIPIDYAVASSYCTPARLGRVALSHSTGPRRVLTI